MLLWRHDYGGGSSLIVRVPHLVSGTNRAEEYRVGFESWFPLIMIRNKYERRRVYLRVSPPHLFPSLLCTTVVHAAARTRNKTALFMSIIGRILVGKWGRTRRCVSVDSSLLPALDLRVRAVLTPVTPREGVNPSSQQYSG